MSAVNQLPKKSGDHNSKEGVDPAENASSAWHSLGKLPKSGNYHKRKRLGRGKSSGCGGTSTKGHKGQKARAGCRIPHGFEGGQMPLARRLPKFGFTNKRFKCVYDIVSTKQLNDLYASLSTKEGSRVKEDNKSVVIDCDLLYRKGYVGKRSLVKVLGKEPVKEVLHVEVQKFSRSARLAIEKAGGKAVDVKPKKVNKKPNRKISATQPMSGITKPANKSVQSVLQPNVLQSVSDSTPPASSTSKKEQDKVPSQNQSPQNGTKKTQSASKDKSDNKRKE